MPEKENLVKGCLEKKCYLCKHFIVRRNEFEKCFTCGCEMFRKYVTNIDDVTLIKPDVLLNTSKDF